MVLVLVVMVAVLLKLASVVAVMVVWVLVAQMMVQWAEQKVVQVQVVGLLQLLHAFGHRQ